MPDHQASKTGPVPRHGACGRRRRAFEAGTPEPFLKSTFTDLYPSFSPDGRWLTYQSNESGTNEVHVRAFPPPTSGPGVRWQISNNGGIFPRWFRTGHDLLYQSGDQILTASYTVKGDTFVAEKPRVWIARLDGTQWDLAPDGKRVAVVTPVVSADAPKQEQEVVFLQNFFDDCGGACRSASNGSPAILVPGRRITLPVRDV